MVVFPDNGYAPYGTRIARVLIVGSPSAGKTTIAVPLARFMCPDTDRIVAVDPSVPPKFSALMGVRPERPSTTDRGLQESFFRDLLKRCQDRYPEGETLMVMDESDMYFTQGGRGYGCQALKEIAHVGRGCYLSQIYISRSPLDLSRSQRGLFNLVLIGRNTEPRAAEWWEEYTGIGGFSTVLRDMEEHTFIAYATDRVPHILGIWWVEEGQIVCRDWNPAEPEEEEPTEDQAPPNGEESAAPSPGEPAPTPAASESSGTGTRDGTATTTSEKAAGRPTGSESATNG